MSRSAQPTHPPQSCFVTFRWDPPTPLTLKHDIFMQWPLICNNIAIESIGVDFWGLGRANPGTCPPIIENCLCFHQLLSLFVSTPKSLVFSPISLTSLCQ